MRLPKAAWLSHIRKNTKIKFNIVSNLFFLLRFNKIELLKPYASTFLLLWLSLYRLLQSVELLFESIGDIDSSDA